MTTTTSTSSSSSTSFGTLTVRSVDLRGNPISGLWTVVQSASGAVLQTGFTPLSFTGTVGVQYTISVSNYQTDIFNHWETGSASSVRTLTLGQSTVITAYYSTTNTPTTYTIAVNSYDMHGNPISDLWVEVHSSSDTLLATGFTPFTYTGTYGSTYSVSVANYGNLVFSHWSDGVTTPTETFPLSQATTLIAYYGTG
jgi:hypothetical protein